MIRSAVLILSGNAVASFILLLRNILISRLIPLHDYGIASTLTVVIAAIETVSAFGLQYQIVQAREGDDQRFQAALQGFQLLRGIAASALLFLLAAPIANFLGIPEAIWAYQVLAIVPLLNALAHFDIHRRSRHMVFVPMLLTSTLPALMSLLAIWPLAQILGDWRVMLFSILVQVVTALALSHLLSERPYRLVFDRAITERAFLFGWPLLMNGILLFLVFQGDKMVVGRELGMEALGIFALGTMLTLAPMLIIIGSCQSFFAPQLSRLQDDPTAFRPMALVADQAVTFLSMAASITIFAFAPFLVDHVLHEEFSPLGSLMSCFIVMQALRSFRAGPAIIAMAQGRTSIGMYGNLLRLMALPAIWYAAISGGDLILIAWIAIAGELVGSIVSYILLSWRSSIPLIDLMSSKLIPALILTLISSENILIESEVSYSGAFWIVLISSLGLLALGLGLMGDLRAYVVDQWRRV